MPVTPRAWAVIVAGGSGSRFGGPKQFAPLAGRPVVAWSVDMARTVCAGVVVVLPAGDSTPSGLGAVGLDAAGVDNAGLDAGDLDNGGLSAAAVGERALHAPAFAGVAVVRGGETRSDSVRAGLAAVAADAEIIVVHDAARPLAGPRLWADVVAAVVGGADGAIPVVAVGDTIKLVAADGTLHPVDRTALRAVQTPQAFRAGALRRAHASGAHATDDATLVEAVGGRVALVAGDPANAKITVPSDLIVAAALLAERQPC